MPSPWRVVHRKELPWRESSLLTGGVVSARVVLRQAAGDLSLLAGVAAGEGLEAEGEGVVVALYALQQGVDVFKAV